MQNPSYFQSLFVSAALAAAPFAAFAAEPVGPQTDVVFSYGYRDALAIGVPSTATIIDAEDIRLGQFDFVADALRLSPGVAIAQNGGAGGFASARLRGGSSGQTLVAIDGIVVNDAAAPQGGFNFANLDVADIDRIEVLRGPQSLIWGADAIGGVIFIKTRDSGPQVSAYLEGGSLATARGGATLFGERDGAFVRATISGFRNDGVSRASSGLEKDGYKSIAGSLTAGAPLGASADLTLIARASRSVADLDGFPPPLFNFGDTSEVERTTDYALSGRLAHRAGDKYDGALSIAWSATDRNNEDQGFETFAASGSRLSAHYRGTLHLSPAFSLTGGGEFERTAADVSGVDESATNGAGFALAELVVARALVLSAGVRRDEFSNFDGATTSRIAAVWTPVETARSATRLRASWGEGFRAPTLFELNFDQFGVLPNPNLRPERANGFDAGIEQQVGGSVFRATYFRQRVRDQIDFDFAGNGYFNIDRVNSEGVEVEAEMTLDRSLTLRTVYTFTNAIDLSTDAQVLRTPKHSGSATLAFAPIDPLQLSATLWLNGRENDFPAGNASFAKLDLRASYAVNRALELYGRIENATDASYEDVSGYGEPGLAAFGGVRIRL